MPRTAKLPTIDVPGFVNLDAIVLSPDSLAQFSNEWLEDQIAHLESYEYAPPAAAKALDLVREELARRHGATQPASTVATPTAPATAFARTPAPEPVPAPRMPPDPPAVPAIEHELDDDERAYQAMRAAESPENIAEAERLSARAEHLMAEARAQGRSVDAADAVRLAHVEAGASETDPASTLQATAERLVFEAEQRGEHLHIARAFDLARNPRTDEAVALRVRHRVFEAEERGETLNYADALARVMRDENLRGSGRG